MSKTVVVFSLMRTFSLLMIAATVVASMDYQLGHTGEEPKHRLEAWINQGRGEFIEDLKKKLRPGKDFFSSLKEKTFRILESTSSLKEGAPRILKNYSPDEIHKAQLDVEEMIKGLEYSIEESFKRKEAPKLESENPTNEDVDNAIKGDRAQLVNAMKEGLGNYKEVLGFIEHIFRELLGKDRLTGNLTPEDAKVRENFVRIALEEVEKVNEQLNPSQETSFTRN